MRGELEKALAFGEQGGGEFTVLHPACWGGNRTLTPSASTPISSSLAKLPDQAAMAARGLLCFEGLPGQISVLKNELSAEMQQQTDNDANYPVTLPLDYLFWTNSDPFFLCLCSELKLFV